MVAERNLIDSAGEDDADSILLTKLADKLAARVPRLCELKTIYDGAELIPGQHVPFSLKNSKATEVYKRNMRIANTNIARPMVDSVTVRQRPSSFRLINDRTQNSTEADRMWRQCHMNIKSRDLFHIRNLYGESFALVGNGRGDDYITVLSPWQTIMDADEDSTLVYAYDEKHRKDTLTLYRLERDDNGTPANVYSKTASQPSNKRSLPAEGDDQAIYDIANGDDTKTYKFQPGFTWDNTDKPDNWDYAVSNGALPIQRFSTPDGKGLFEPHLSSIYRIDQETFDRVTITMMQAFVQRAIKGMKRTTYDETDPAVIVGMKKSGDPIDFSEIFQQGPASIWLMPDGADVWESKQTDIQGLNTTIGTDIKQLTDVAMTPLGVNSNDIGGSANGADLKRESVIFKAEDLNERADDKLVTVMKMALSLGQVDVTGKDFETMWKPITAIQFSNPAQDASQLKGVVSDKTIERMVLGMSEQQIAEDDLAKSTELIDQSLMDSAYEGNGNTDETNDDGISHRDGRNDKKPSLLQRIFHRNGGKT